MYAVFQRTICFRAFLSYRDELRLAYRFRCRRHLPERHTQQQLS